MSQETEDQRRTKKVSRWIRFARYVTGIYFFTIAVFTILFVSVNKSWFSFNYELNQLGDFLTGVFAPIGFLWLVVGYLVQAEEFRTQAEELKNQTEQLRDEVQATKVLAELAGLQAHEQRNKVAPLFSASLEKTGTSESTLAYEFVLRNSGNSVDKVQIHYSPPEGGLGQQYLGRVPKDSSKNIFGTSGPRSSKHIPTPTNPIVAVLKCKSQLQEYLYYLLITTATLRNFQPFPIEESEYVEIFELIARSENKPDFNREFIVEKAKDIYINSEARGGIDQL